VRGGSRPAATLATGLALAAGLAFTASGCGGGGDEGTGATDATPPGPDPITVAVRDGDTGAPVAGARVIAFRGRTAIARAVADDRPEVWVPRWLRVGSTIRAVAPGTFRRLSARFGEPIRIRGRGRSPS